jgi:hypothetical protein
MQPDPDTHRRRSPQDFLPDSGPGLHRKPPRDDCSERLAPGLAGQARLAGAAQRRGQARGQRVGQAVPTRVPG